LLAEGKDPNLAKQETKRAAKIARNNTFEAVAREWLNLQRRRLAPRYTALLQARLEADVFPYLGSRPIAEIGAPELLDVLQKVERRGVLETARRLRQICGQVFRYAIAKGLSKYDPSAGLRGALSSPGKPRSHKAIPLQELPDFIVALSSYEGDQRTQIALRLIVLTFVRTSELRAAKWSEIEKLESEEPLWRIPGERTKMKREHIVPLAPPSGQSAAGTPALARLFQ